MSEERASSDPFLTPATLRSLNEIQRRGLQAANEVIARLSSTGASGPLFGAASEERVDGSAPMWDPNRYAAAVEQFAALASVMAGAFGGTPSAPPNGTIAFDPLAMPAGQPGGRSTAVLWLHNRSGTPVGRLRPHSGELRSSSGATIPADAVTFDPPEIDALPDLSSRGLAAAVSIPSDAQSGRFRGVVSVDGHDDLWLPIEVVVETP